MAGAGRAARSTPPTRRPPPSLWATRRSPGWSGTAGISTRGTGGEARPSCPRAHSLGEGAQPRRHVAHEPLHLLDGLLANHAGKVRKNGHVFEPQVALQASDVFGYLIGCADEPRPLGE